MNPNKCFTGLKKSTQNAIENPSKKKSFLVFKS